MRNYPETGVLATAGKAAPSAAELRLALERILQSRMFANSELLRKLLAFYTERTLQGAESPKEHEIATLGLGRSADFDPRVDSTVRVQTGRLRSKLAEYYIHEGMHDPVVLEIPKGSYHVEYRYSASADPVPVPLAPVAPSPARRRLWPAVAIALVALIAVAALLSDLWRKPSPSPESVLGLFWHDFIRVQHDPLVVFSNARFVGSSSEGLRYFREGADAAESMDDSYTGTGEVIAVHELTKVFMRFGTELRVKRAQLLSWDDARQSNLILIGSPEQNLTMAEMRWLNEFRFKPHNAEPRIGHVGIINLHPRPGEEQFYFGSPKRPVRYEYGIVALVRGIHPERRAVVVAGTGTLGTQAAAEFVCTPRGVSAILARLGLPANSRVPPFEAVIHVQVNGGVPVDTRLLLIRTEAKE